MNSNKILTSVFIFLLLVVAVLFYILKGPQTGTSQNLTPSSDILYLTMPVTSFAGTVEKIEGNTMTLTQKATLQQQPPVPISLPGTTVNPIPTPIQKTITLKVQVDKNTSITKSSNMIPYLFKKTGATPVTLEKIAISDLKTGQNVTVMTDTDLRFNLAKTPKALSVALSPIVSVVSGRISAINDQTLTVVSSVPAMTSQKPKEITYTVNVTSETELSRNIYPTNPSTDPSKMTPPTPVKVSFSELKKDMFVTVYTDVDTTTEKNITALRIEPQVITPLSGAPVVPTVPVSATTASPAAK